MLKLAINNQGALRLALDDQPESLITRRVAVDGRWIEVELEWRLWRILDGICLRERINLHHLCSSLARAAGNGMDIIRAIQLFALAYGRATAREVRRCLNPPANATPRAIALAYQRPN